MKDFSEAKSQSISFFIIPLAHAKPYQNCALTQILRQIIDQISTKINLFF